MYRIERKIVEELREKDLNATDLLQEYVKKQLKSVKITYEIDNETV